MPRLFALAALGLLTVCVAAPSAAEEFFAAFDREISISPAADGCGGIAAGCAGLADEPADDCCDNFNGRKRILGLLPSDHCFDRFVSPLSNPFFFEDPRSLTEVRGLFVDNTLPRATTQGGDMRVFAAQVRGRIADRWSLIAPRIGNLQINNQPNGFPDGMMSAPVGVKYNFFRDVESQTLVSAGATYFITGSRQVFQGFGTGDFHFFLTGGKEFFGRAHWLSATGLRVPANANWGTQFWYWSNQWDYELPGRLYPVMGINWFHWMRSSGVAAANGVTGLDLINLPAGAVAGNNFATYTIGARWKPGAHVEIGGGWEVPLTGYKDLMGNRVYADFIVRY